MTKKGVRKGALITLLFVIAPFVAYASSTATAVLTINQVSLNLSGPSDTLESLVSNTSNATITLEPGSFLTIIAPGHNKIIETGGDSIITSEVCDNSGSSISFTYPPGTGSNIAVTITPSSTVCGTPGAGLINFTAPTSAATPTSATPTTAPTSSTPFFDFTRPLSVGSTGVDVTALQTLLTSLGVYHGPITGYFGVLTQGGVTAFQASKSLPTVGVVGPLTRAALNASQ